VRGEQQGYGTEVRLEKLTGIYHQREQVEDEHIKHISPAFAMNLVMLDMVDGEVQRIAQEAHAPKKDQVCEVRIWKNQRRPHPLGRRFPEDLRILRRQENYAGVPRSLTSRLLVLAYSFLYCGRTGAQSVRAFRGFRLV